MSRFDEADDPRRRLLIKALTAGVISAALMNKVALAESIFGSTPRKLPSGRSIYRLRGMARVNGQDANLATFIKPNDTIQTFAKSELVFVVGGHAVILRENSHIRLAGKDDKASFLIQGIRIVAGKLLAVSRSQGTQIRTSTATIGIRGTGYYIESEPDKTYFCTCYGLSDVESTDDPSSKDTVVSKYHDKPLYIFGSEPEGKNIRPAPFINHTDQELMLIETLVGRTPPFVFAGDEYSAPRREY
ncbi:MAG: FecR domain-containing protein [Pseudomonadota bacterium]